MVALAKGNSWVHGWRSRVMVHTCTVVRVWVADDTFLQSFLAASFVQGQVPRQGLDHNPQAALAWLRHPLLSLDGLYVSPINIFPLDHVCGGDNVRATNTKP